MRLKTILLLPALSLFGAGAGLGQVDNPPMTNVPTAPKPHIVPVEQPVQPIPQPVGTTASGDPMDPAKVAEYQRRFQEGYQLQQAGKLGDARTIYDNILAEQPQAKRSLLEAGRVSLMLGQPTKADEYLSKLHAIVPDFPEAIELLIQASQELKHDVKVELLLRDFRALHDSGKIPELTKTLCFVRERITDSKQTIVISQFFNYMESPNTVYMAEVFDLSGNIQRRILLNYDDDTTKALRAKDAKYQTTEVFTWFEHKMNAGKVTEIDAYLQVFALPDYNKFRSAMLVILADPPKPIYSAPVGTAAPQ
jgi:tetratricopeptide (TPR) repeat protein